MQHLRIVGKHAFHSAIVLHVLPIVSASDATSISGTSRIFYGSVDVSPCMDNPMCQIYPVYSCGEPRPLPHSPS